MRFLSWALLLYLCTNALAVKGMEDTLRVAYTRAAPFVITDAAKPDGISIWLWEKIAYSLDIEYELVEMEFGPILNGLENGTIDLSINPLTVTAERSKRMDFTYPFYASNSTVAVREMTTLNRFMQFLGSFFSLNFLRAMIGMILLISFFGIIAWLFERKKNPEHFRPGWKGLWDGIWWSVVTMTTVGYGDKAPKSSGGKFVALIWMFSGLLFISGLTASVASSLTVNQLNWNTDSISDFKNRPVGTIQSTGTEDYLRHHFFKQVKAYPNLTEGLKGVKTGEVEAFLYDEPILKYRLSQEEGFEELEILPIKFDLQFYAFAFSANHSELNRKVSQKILEYTEGVEWRILLSEYDLSEL